MNAVALGSFAGTYWVRTRGQRIRVSNCFRSTGVIVKARCWTYSANSIRERSAASSL
jgi:hypothetical protein